MTKRKPDSNETDEKRSRNYDDCDNGSKKAPEPTFEAALGELESIVRSLENGGDSLEKALEDYSQAVDLLKVCHKKLEHAERRVAILSGMDANGNPVTEAIEETQETLEEKRHSRGAKRTATKRRASGNATAGTKDPELF